MSVFNDKIDLYSYYTWLNTKHSLPETKAWKRKWKCDPGMKCRYRLPLKKSEVWLCFFHVLYFKKYYFEPPFGIIIRSWSVHRSWFTHCLLVKAWIWAAIRSKSRRPWELNRRPPLGSFSTSFNCSKFWRALRAMVPEPALQWLGALPLLRRTEINKSGE